jgi:hypothetical protein
MILCVDRVQRRGEGTARCRWCIGELWETTGSSNFCKIGQGKWIRVSARAWKKRESRERA